MAKGSEILQIANTTFRRPWRIPEGLRVLNEFNSKYDFKNNRVSEVYESGLIKAISETGVLESQGQKKEWAGGHGRKFLNLCQKFGFISPRPKTIHGKGMYSLNDNGEDTFLVNFLNSSKVSIQMEKFPFSLTPLGKKLSETFSEEYEITSEQKDIFLKSLYYQLQPSLLHKFGKKFEGEKIRPLQYFIKILLNLKESDIEASLSFGEISLIVNTAWTNDISKVISEIKNFRKFKRGKERKFSKAWYEKIGGKAVYKVDFDTIWTYADPNISYLISTGLFDRLGKKIVLNKDKLEISKIISNEGILNFNDDIEYLSKFWSGDLLPFEDEEYLKDKAQSNYNTLTRDYNFNDENISTLMKGQKEFKKIIYKTEDKLQELKEIEFFKQQRLQTEEISLNLSSIEEDKLNYNGIEFEPEPEHLEWIVWRAFLAINSFKNEIKNTRGFKIDGNFLPTHHAAGGKEDLFFEFEDYYLIVEVTFKTSGNQFKDEVEPVYRHTARRMKLVSDKPVYCLFIAPRIDLNLASSFQRNYYDSKENEYTGNIIPISINQFALLFLKLFHQKKVLTPKLFKDIFDEILEKKETTSPKNWMSIINSQIENRLSL